MAGPIVTFTSDFGLRDAYVAQMKAAVLKEAPDAQLVDVTHEIPPQDVLAGSFALERTVASFPAGSVHLAVIDPGVGTNRPMLVVTLAGQIVVCPDNGLITWSWCRHAPQEAHVLTWRPPQHSNTFHGRDIMGPAAGRLARGDDLSTLASPIEHPQLLEIAPVPLGSTVGKVIHVDRFGNCTTNIPRECLPERVRMVQVGVHAIGPLRNTYADVDVGKPLALIGSAGLLEVAARNRSIAEKLMIGVGATVEVR